MKETMCYVIISDCEQTSCTKDCNGCSFYKEAIVRRPLLPEMQSELGHSVFLTRAEAEAHLVEPAVFV